MIFFSSLPSSRLSSSGLSSEYIVGWSVDNMLTIVHSLFFLLDIDTPDIITILLIAAALLKSFYYFSFRWYFYENEREMRSRVSLPSVHFLLLRRRFSFRFCLFPFSAVFRHALPPLLFHIIWAPTYFHYMPPFSSSRLFFWCLHFSFFFFLPSFFTYAARLFVFISLVIIRWSSDWLLTNNDDIIV